MRSRSGGIFQIDHGYAIVEIRAEEPLPDRMGDVPVGGRDKAEVHADGLRSAHAMEAALLKDPQELGLHPRAGLREFIQKQRAVFGHFHQTGLAGHGSRERSLFMPEELALEQLVLKARHVDDDKPAVPAAFLVDVPGHHLLAHAGFPAKQDGSVGFAASSTSPRNRSISSETQIISPGVSASVSRRSA